MALESLEAGPSRFEGDGVRARVLLHPLEHGPGRPRVAEVEQDLRKGRHLPCAPSYLGGSVGRYERSHGLPEGISTARGSSATPRRAWDPPPTLRAWPHPPVRAPARFAHGPKPPGGRQRPGSCVRAPSSAPRRPPAPRSASRHRGAVRPRPAGPGTGRRRGEIPRPPRGSGPGRRGHAQGSRGGSVPGSARSSVQGPPGHGAPPGRDPRPRETWPRRDSARPQGAPPGSAPGRSTRPAPRRSDASSATSSANRSAPGSSGAMSCELSDRERSSPTGCRRRSLGPRISPRSTAWNRSGGIAPSPSSSRPSGGALPGAEARAVSGHAAGESARAGPAPPGRVSRVHALPMREQARFFDGASAGGALGERVGHREFVQGGGISHVGSGSSDPTWCPDGLTDPSSSSNPGILLPPSLVIRRPPWASWTVPFSGPGVHASRFPPTLLGLFAESTAAWKEQGPRRGWLPADRHPYRSARLPVTVRVRPDGRSMVSKIEHASSRDLTPLLPPPGGGGFVTMEQCAAIRYPHDLRSFP